MVIFQLLVFQLFNDLPIQTESRENFLAGINSHKEVIVLTFFKISLCRKADVSFS